MQVEDLLEVVVGADDRAADGQPAEHGLEDRDAQPVLRRQPDAHERAAARERAKCLLERDRVDRGRDRGIGAAERLDRGHDVLLAGMHGMLGSELERLLEPGGIRVDCDHRRARDARVLDRQVAEAAHAEHRDEAGGVGRSATLTAL